MSLKMDKNVIIREVNSISNIKELDNLRIKYLGKKGLISLEMKSLSSLAIDEKKIKGQELNDLKSIVEKQIENKKNEIENELINEKIIKE